MIHIRNNNCFSEMANIIGQFPDLDKLLSGLTLTPKTLTTNTVKLGIDTLIYLKHSIQLSASLLHSIKEIKSSEIESMTLFEQIYSNFNEITLNEIENWISELLIESTQYSKSVSEMRYQECFAIKIGADGLLDVARKTYLQTVEDINKVNYTTFERI